MKNIIIPELVSNGLESNILSSPTIQAERLVEEAKETEVELKDFEVNPTKDNLKKVFEEALDVQTKLFSIMLYIKESVDKETVGEIFGEAYKSHIDKLERRNWTVGGAYEINYKDKY